MSYPLGGGGPQVFSPILFGIGQDCVGGGEILVDGFVNSQVIYKSVRIDIHLDNEGRGRQGRERGIESTVWGGIFSALFLVINLFSGIGIFFSLGRRGGLGGGGSYMTFVHKQSIFGFPG